MDVRHAEVCGGVFGGQLAHRGKLLASRGQARLDRGDLAEPSLVLCFLETVQEVGLDLLEAGPFGGVRAKL
jgi:hypothetical protein